MRRLSSIRRGLSYDRAVSGDPTAVAVLVAGVVVGGLGAWWLGRRERPEPEPSAPAPAAARRGPATVLFADIRGFTHLSQQRDPDVVLALLAEYSRVMTRALGAEGGAVQRVLGDGLLAVFEGMDDHAGAGVRAALSMQAEAERLSPWWEERAGSPLRIVVALASGEVLVGRLVGEGLDEPVLLGDTVNVAARLEAEAKKAGVEILLTDQTARLISGTFPFRNLGPHHLRGRAGEIDLFALGVPRAGDATGHPFRTRKNDDS